jgi:predicted short-subunit dehydrogenase-like oxidoreductase (DUF2520 family)
VFAAFKDLIMTQVPHYLIIGNGHVAKHFQNYFSLLSFSYEVWHREEPLSKLESAKEKASHILLLISDNAIESFALQYLKNTKAYCVHFSGSIVCDTIFGAHPLMGFGSTLYTLEQYQAIPFVIDHDAPLFNLLLPGLLNQHVRLDKSKKIKYHALCVLSGNFSCMLWQKFFSALELELNIPFAIGFPYLEQQTQNLLKQYNKALTGPLVRGDLTTIENHLAALNHDPFQEIYQSFVSCYERLKENA